MSTLEEAAPQLVGGLPSQFNQRAFPRIACLPKYTVIKNLDSGPGPYSSGNINFSTETLGTGWLRCKSARIAGSCAFSQVIVRNGVPADTTGFVQMSLENGSISPFQRLVVFLNGANRELDENYNLEGGINLLYGRTSASPGDTLDNIFLLEGIVTQNSDGGSGYAGGFAMLPTVTNSVTAANNVVNNYPFVHYIRSKVLGYDAEYDFFPICFFKNVQFQLTMDTLYNYAYQTGYV